MKKSSLKNLKKALKYDPNIFAFIEWRNIFDEKNKQKILKEVSQKIDVNKQLTIYQQVQNHMILLSLEIKNINGKISLRRKTKVTK
jgi:hypothetical protein